MVASLNISHFEIVKAKICLKIYANEICAKAEFQNYLLLMESFLSFFLTWRKLKTSSLNVDDRHLRGLGHALKFSRVKKCVHLNFTCEKLNEMLRNQIATIKDSELTVMKGRSVFVVLWYVLDVMCQMVDCNFYKFWQKM
ncbi:hypothetical protein T4C_1703 [Trichinella pseudospiralis]|uniref:Uncharacterized protein n=1 Tax=Trichinella pseudospiralis TaxID=6337 RepID=A0A0V1IVW5_TRIPS|nr:hypothetical protein T4C_1703 [Trichinella pseudospiralis]